MRRQEIRAWLRSMPDDQRRSYVAANLEHFDPETALAILSANRALAAQHGDAIKEVIELARAADIASFAVEAVRTEIARDVGVVDPIEFDRLAQPFEKGVDQPRLKKFMERDGNGGQVEVVRKLQWNEDRSTGGSWTRATAEEIAAATYIESAS
jgi:hypothetical protein